MIGVETLALKLHSNVKTFIGMAADNETFNESATYHGLMPRNKRDVTSFVFNLLYFLGMIILIGNGTSLPLLFGVLAYKLNLHEASTVSKFSRFQRLLFCVLPLICLCTLVGADADKDTLVC